MQYASEDLMKEHEGILFGLKILEQMFKSVEERCNADTRDLAEMLNFLSLFADKCHHGKEEGLMFPAMERVGVPNERGPIGQMLLEHNEGRKYIAEMKASLNDGLLQANRFTIAARGYIKLMRAHIEKENTVLFPLGDQKLPLTVQEQLLQQFEEFEEEVMGQGTHERLHKLLEEFAAKYLAE